MDVMICLCRRNVPWPNKSAGASGFFFFKKGQNFDVLVIPERKQLFLLTEAVFRVYAQPWHSAPRAVKLRVKSFAQSYSGALGGLGLNFCSPGHQR